MSFSRSLQSSSHEIWEQGYNHPFVQGLGDGSLPRKAFEFYLVQDYKYLLEYAKVFALGVVKSPSEELMAKFSAAQDNILNGEMELHRSYMKSFGLVPSKAETVTQSLFSKAYTTNMLSTAYEYGPAEILAVIFPCAHTYYDYACRLKQQHGTIANNPYQSWLDMYASQEFADSFAWFFDALDNLCEHMPESKLDHLREIFNTSVQFEYLFWDMAYTCDLGAERIQRTSK